MDRQRDPCLDCGHGQSAEKRGGNIVRMPLKRRGHGEQLIPAHIQPVQGVCRYHAAHKQR